jgi:transcription initiation factor IIE alpha subunit
MNYTDLDIANALDIKIKDIRRQLFNLDKNKTIHNEDGVLYTGYNSIRIPKELIPDLIEKTEIILLKNLEQLERQFWDL